MSRIQYMLCYINWCIKNHNYTNYHQDELLCNVNINFNYL